MNTRTELRRDVVVVGCGIAGLSAAASALEAGASVVCLERADRDDFGGNTRWTDAYFRMKDEHTVSDDFEEALISNAGHHIDPNIIRHVADPYEAWPGYVKAFGMTDPELVSTLAAQAGPTVQWLKRFGIRFAALPTYFMTAAAPRIMPVGGGLALIEALRAHALSAGGELLYETAARQLDRDESSDDADGWVLQAIGPQGRPVRIYARSVVLASGGFQGNPEMLGQYIGPTARYVRPVARGGWYNKGEGIRMALAAGAAPAGDFTSYHAEPVDPRALRPEGLVMNFPYGILVNQAGRRFVDEAPGPVDLHYDPISRSIKDQPDGLVHVIFDAGIDDVPNWKRSIRTEQPPLQADSIEALARLCGIAPGALQRTIDDYNRCCTGGEFSPLTVDGLSTQGLEPPKSNWARPIKRAPFFAYPIISTVCFTYGGIKTDSTARVVDTDGRPIPGLYAAGEMTGLYHQVYTGATSVMRGAVFGRLAGQHAATR